MGIRGTELAGRLGWNCVPPKQLKSLWYFPDTIYEKADVTKN
jgi:hypothetical protein